MVQLWRESSIRQRFAMLVLSLWVLVALLANFLANDKPLLCSYEGRVYSPVLHEMAVTRGWAGWPEEFKLAKWKALKYDWAIWPPVRFKPSGVGEGSTVSYRRPGYRTDEGAHYLGTHKLGHDIAAGMIHGARSALVVGLSALALLTIIGLCMGMSAGFLGNRLPVKVYTLIILIPFILAGIFYGLLVYAYPFEATWPSWLVALWRIFLLLSPATIIYVVLDRWIKGPQIQLPYDSLVTMLMDGLNAIPLIFIVLVLSLVLKSSVWGLVLIIGLTGWTGVARLSRAETMQVNSKDYMWSAKVLGVGVWRQLWVHVWPNIRAGVFVALSFGLANIIMVEAFLSFLGVGLPSTEITWGTILQSTREYSGAWWVAIFPGTAIFLIVLSLNIVAEMYEKRASGRLILF